MTALLEIREILSRKTGKGKNTKYFIPSLWVQDNFKKSPWLLRVNPCEFYIHQIDDILRFPPAPPQANRSEDWSKEAIVYNMLVRLTTAFDHNQNGKLETRENYDGFRETGTFLKSIALLPYIQKLGANAIHLLPVTTIGRDGKKGSLGSPYAVKNPFLLDENLSEPFLGAGAETEFKAFVEAAHHLGIRVVVEFVLRTASRDSDWVKEHPEWFYWIKDSVRDRPYGSFDPSQYGPPVFTPEQLKKVEDNAAQKNFSVSLPPPDIYTNMFTQPPARDKIKKEHDRWIGVLADGTRVKVPGAFADWPPDDIQPPWNDVTYLKLYEHPDFNYIAYNTIRMYDDKLAEKENINRSLWDKITEIIPHYEREFGIDGVMIDMGHALPRALFSGIVNKARAINPQFAFWEENFSPNKESLENGYNAALGYVWLDEHKPEKIKDLILRFSREGIPLPIFGTPETHNCPRAVSWEGGAAYSRFAWAINNFLPLIPFLHSGYELGEKTPVNTGLNFTSDEIIKYPSEKLPLFSESALDWFNPGQFPDWIQKIALIRKSCKELVTDTKTVKPLETNNAQVCAFERKNHRHHLIIVGNANMTETETLEMIISCENSFLVDLISRKRFDVGDGLLKLTLAPAEVLALSIE